MNPSVKISIQGLGNLDVMGDIKAAIRPAAQAGAQVIYDDVKKNVGRLGSKTGNLAAAIYQAYSKDHSSETRATYHVSWNKRKAPHGHLIEFGYLQRYKVIFKNGKFITLKKRKLPQPKQVPAMPFMRPAIGKIPQAEAAVMAELKKRL